MEYYSSHINKLIEQFSHLPGIGAKSAQRLAFHIMNMPKEQVQQLTNAITDARMNVQRHPPAPPTLDHRGESPAVLEQDRLLTPG